MMKMKRDKIKDLEIKAKIVMKWKEETRIRGKNKQNSRHRDK